MSTTAETHAAVEELLTSKFITFTITYGNETRRGDWACDMWSIYMFSPLSKPAFRTLFYTGLGHRKTPKRKQYGWENELPYKVVRPHIASVIHSLMLDSGALDESFDVWCDNFGYSSDSIKAFNLYRECCEVAKNFRPLFDRDTYQQLSKLLEDY